MITKYEKYWHFYFNEQCKDTPEEILKLVEKMFTELREIPECSLCFLRVRPRIIRSRKWEGGMEAAVFCRLSAKVDSFPQPDDDVQITGFGLPPK